MTVIVAWLWQGTAIAAGTALLMRLAQRQSAATRYVIWWMALVAVVLLPAAHLRPTWTGSSGSISAVWPVNSDPVLVLPAPPDWLGACLLGAWLGAVLVGIGRIAHGTLAVLQLKRHTVPVEPGIVQSLHAWRDYSKDRRRAVLCTARQLSAASALGLFGRPTIVLSEALVHSLDRTALDQVVLHEQAHLSRYDDWTRLLQALLSAVCGLHPAVHFIAARLDLEREAACDAVVVARTGNAVRYAACLADVADTTGRQTARRGWSAAQGAIGSGDLLARVRRLLDPQRQPSVGVRAFDLATASLLLLVTVLIAPHVSRSVVVVEVQGMLPLPHRPLPTFHAWSVAPEMLALAALAVDEPISQTVASTSPLATGPVVGVRTRAEEAVPSKATSSAYASFTEERELPHQESAPHRGPAPLVSRPLPGHVPASLDHRAENDGLEPDDQTASVNAHATIPALADLSSIGDASVAVGRAVGRFSTSTGNGTRRASVAVGGWFGRAGKAVAGSF